MKKAEKLHLLETSEGPWQEISINIIGPLLKSNDKDMIVIMVVTKIIKLKMTTMVVLSENIAKIYRNEIWKIYRVLQKVLSSKGPQFTL